MPRDIHALVADASTCFLHRILSDKDGIGLRDFGEKSIARFMSAQDDDNTHKNTTKHLDKEDFSKAMERSKKRNASALGTPKASNLYDFLVSIYSSS